MCSWVAGLSPFPVPLYSCWVLGSRCVSRDAERTTQNYPNSQKYISLFPPSSRSAADEEIEDGDEVPDDGKVMPILRKSKAGADETDRRRSELVENVRKLMTEGR